MTIPRAIFAALCFWLLGVLAAISICRSAHSEPLRLEAQAGVCKHGIADKGTWWNTDYPTNTDAESGCFQVGASQIVSEWRSYKLGWRAAYVDFGRVSADNVFTMHDSEQFIGVTGAECDAVTLRGCLGRGIISQKTRGVSVGGLIERDMGGWVLGGEAGGYVYYSRFRVAVLPQPAGAWNGPLSADWAGWNFTPYIGATVTRGMLFVSVRSYLTIRASESCTGCTGISSGLSYQAMVGLQVPLQ
jgi:hypothetical protein